MGTCRIPKAIKGTESPCFGCNERFRACQDVCPRFLKYKSKRAEEKVQFMKYREETDPMPARIIGGISTMDYNIKKSKERRRGRK